VEPRLDVITLVVADLERALAFYCDLGFKSKGIIGTEWTDEVTGANGALRCSNWTAAYSSTCTRGPISPRTRRFQVRDHIAKVQPRTTRS
jgi:hypothetical protein